MSTATAKVLVVEDEGIIAKDIQYRLGRMGYEVFSPVATGAAAIEKTEEYGPDLILMDIVLKGDMSGIQAVMRIRERFDVPVIYLTANSDSHTVAEAKLTAPNGFLLKPFKDADAQVCIEMALYKHRFDQELRKKDEELATILRCVGDAIVATDEKGTITFMNQAGEALAGWTEEDARGRNLEDVAQIVDATSQEPFSTLVPLDQLEVRRRNHSVLLAKDGSRPAIEHTSAPVLDEKRGRMGSVVVLRDVTEREQAQAELQSHRERLRELVAERTKELTEANEELTREIYEHKRTTLALQRAKEEAEAASQTKSDFLANMSHEIRNPMHGVLGLTELLLLSNLTPEQRRNAEGISESGESLIAIVNDILDFSKLDAGKLRMETIPFDLETVLNSTKQLLLPKAEKKNLELATRYAAAAPRKFFGDPNRMSQILTNVIGNAIKFTDQGRVIVDVDCLSLRAGEAEMRIRVEDTGIGIEQEAIEHIFDMFSQADTSATRLYGGTGLGLAITQSLLRLIDGTIDLESEIGKGTVFTLNFVLPLEMSARPAKVNPEPRQIKEDALFSELNSPRILLVEDNEINQSVALGFLEALGCRSDLAVNGQEAIDMVAKTRYDLVFMDIQMPGMDGLAATKKIRESETENPVRIIAMTAHAMQGDRERCIEAGMIDHVTKPLHLDTLRALFHKYFGPSQT